MNKCKFLNLEADISGQEIWNDGSFSKLWLYNLHYFDDLIRNRSTKVASWHKIIISRWIKENPIGFGVGWEPYPISRRVVNWVKWILLGNKPSLEMVESIFSQSSWLNKRLEFHLLGNHLIANAKALVFSGLLIDGGVGKRWFERGMYILREQVDEQILDDGGHFELSPMYHLIVLEDLLDVVQALRCYERTEPRWLSSAIQKMLDWSRIMRHPDKAIPFFNDCSFGVSSTPEDVDSYASNLGFFSQISEETNYLYLQSSGYLRVKSQDVTVFMDLARIGPDYLPGHSHADSLSFEMSLFSDRLFVNSGSSEYETSARRLAERSTINHNALSIDGINSSEVWSSFRVARRARVSEIKIEDNENQLIVKGSHDGYRRLSSRLKHTRTWSVSGSKIELSDVVDGSGSYDLIVHFHLGPSWFPKIVGRNLIKICNVNNHRHYCNLVTNEDVKIELKQQNWAFQFGEHKKIWSISVKKYTALPAKIISRIDWT